jgi:AraC-like DNA-binding protein
MHYVEVRPAERLAPWVRAIWSLRSVDSGPPEGRVERVLPDGCVELVFHLREPFFARSPRGVLHRQAESLVAGPSTRPTELARGADSEVLGVRLQPGGASLLGLPQASALRDRIAPLDDLGVRGLRGLRERLLAAAPAARLAMLQCVLLERTRAQHPPRLATALQALDGRGAWSDGQPAAALARALGVSRRQAERICQSEAAMTPRELLRIQRFQRALRAIEARPGLSLAWIAQAAGFADESHLCREFRVFAGVTPGEHRRARTALTAAFIARD